MEEEWIQDNDEIVKRRASHIRSCCAFGCTSKGYRLLIAGERVQYFPFPLADLDMCQRWATGLNIPPDLAYEKAFVCSKHFRSTDYKSRIYDDSKRTLRRTAIPSLEPVVNVGKGPTRKKPAASETSSDDTEEEEEVENNKEITSVISKETNDGDNLTLLLVKDPAEELDEEIIEKPKVLEESKKIPILCRDLLAAGPPYPWRKVGLEAWATERLEAHALQLEKTREAAAAEVEQMQLIQDQIEARKEILTLLVVKKTKGQMVLSNYLRSLPP